MGTSETETLRARLDAARQRERDARAMASRIAREMKAADRRRETQMLCVLGRAWLALGDRVPTFRESGSRFLADYVTRDTDREVLRGTPWELRAAAPPAQPEGADHG